MSAGFTSRQRQTRFRQARQRWQLPSRRKLQISYNGKKQQIQKPYGFSGARSRTRTGTDLSVRGILSPLCLPIPPSGRDRISITCSILIFNGPPRNSGVAILKSVFERFVFHVPSGVVLSNRMMPRVHHELPPMEYPPRPSLLLCTYGENRAIREPTIFRLSQRPFKCSADALNRPAVACCSGLSSADCCIFSVSKTRSATSARSAKARKFQTTKPASEESD